MEKFLIARNNLIVGAVLLVTHETALAHDPGRAMIFIGAFLLIPGAIAASIAEEKRVWWFLGSVPLVVVSVLLAFSTDVINPFLILALPLIIIPMSIWQNRRLENARKSESENAS